jgi:hypothetical protein
VALIDLQRAVLAICFRAEPPQAALQELGDPQRWLLYRDMVRERLLREIRAALPRSSALLGAAALERAFSWHLEHDPPRTRYFRQIVGAFLNSALPLWAADPELPAAGLDLARYEGTLWEVADLDASLPELPGEFAFDRIPVLSPALRLLTVSHAVHLPSGPDADYAVAEYLLCVHRAPGAQRARTWTLTRSTYQLLQHWQSTEQTVADSVQQLARQRGVRVDARYVDGLCAALAQFIEAGIVVGSR